MYFIENIMKHSRGQLARLGVIAAAMVRIDQASFSGECMNIAMGKCVVFLFQRQTFDYRSMGDPTQGQDYSSFGHGVQFSGQIGIAGGDLIAQGFVFRGQAFYRVGNPAMFQAQAVVPRAQSK